MNEGFGKDFYRKGNSVKRFGPFALKIEKLLSSSPSQKSALTSGSSERGRCRRGRSEIPHFSVNGSRLPLFQENKKSEEKRKKRRKNENPSKKRKNGKIPPTPSTPTPLRTSQLRYTFFPKSTLQANNSRSTSKTANWRGLPPETRIFSNFRSGPGEPNQRKVSS